MGERSADEQKEVEENGEAVDEKDETEEGEEEDETEDGDEEDDDDDDDEDNDKNDAAFRKLIDNLKALYDTAKVSGSLLSQSDQEERLGLFDRIFDKSLERYRDGERAGGYQELLQDTLIWADNEKFIFRAFRYKRLGPDLFDQYVRFTTDDDELIIQSNLWFNVTTSLVVKIETRRLQRRKKLPGQVSASGVWQIWPGFLERDFASTVYALPREVKDTLFLGGSDDTPSSFGLNMPVIEKYEMIRVHMKRDEVYSTKSALAPRRRRLRHNLQFKTNDYVRLYDERNVPLADGAYWKFTKQKKILGFGSQRWLLYNAKDQPLCMCLRENVKNERVYMIYGRHKIGQRQVVEPPHAQQLVKTELVDFYGWFRLRVSKEVQLVYVWQNQAFEPLFRLTSVSNDLTNAQMPISLHASSSAATDSSSWALRAYDKEDHIFAVISKETADKDGAKAPGSEVLIAPGVDPAMVLAIAVCVNQISFT